MGTSTTNVEAIPSLRGSSTHLPPDQESLVTTNTTDTTATEEEHHHQHHDHDHDEGDHHHHHKDKHSKKKKKKKDPGPKKPSACVHHFKGVLWLLLLLVFHAVCFIGTISMGLGVGVLAVEFHEICWAKPLDPFWATYIMLIFVYISAQLYFQLVVGTKLRVWFDKKLSLFRIELYFIPRVLYTMGYILAVVNLYLQYMAIHQTSNGDSIMTNSNLTAFNSSNAPLVRVYDGYQHSTLFILSLAYMMYVLTKESDWITHRAISLARGDPDPMEYGSLSNLLIMFFVHFFLTIIYALPLVGWSFMMYKFTADAPATYFTVCPIAICIGVFASFLERRPPFPITPMSPPTYAYENHIRVRVSMLHYWLIPLSSGRFFNTNWAKTMDATNYDFLVFSIEVGIGVLQVSKIIGNDIYLLYTNWGYDKKIPLTVQEATPNPLTNPDDDAAISGSSSTASVDLDKSSGISPTESTIGQDGQKVNSGDAGKGPIPPKDETLAETEWPSQASISGRKEPVQSLVRKLV